MCRARRLAAAAGFWAIREAEGVLAGGILPSSCARQPPGCASPPAPELLPPCWAGTCAGAPKPVAVLPPAPKPFVDLRLLRSRLLRTNTKPAEGSWGCKWTGWRTRAGHARVVAECAPVTVACAGRMGLATAPPHARCNPLLRAQASTKTNPLAASRRFP